MAMEVPSREKIVQNWLPRYTGMPLGEFGMLILFTDFFAYVQKFSSLFAAPIRGEGTGLDYFPIEVPALPSFRLHALVAEEIVKKDQDYRTSVVYTTNRRVWEHDEEFKDYFVRMRAIEIDIETATLFLVGHHNEIPRGALLLVSDVPVIPEGIKTEEMDREVSTKFSAMHLEIGIATMESLQLSGEKVKHLRY